ncbi:MAG TPA: hypothetical protein VHE30_08890 [Polyangiaceae bacterium]|nr:hypothetical protein [Polyangiaceae bacterium]
MSPLLVVAGEASGDAFAAPVVSRLGVGAFGLGGRRLREAGADVLFDATEVAAMGARGALVAPRLGRALATVARRISRERPRAALLVGFSEVNALVARLLAAKRIRVLWYAPPQAWAWRRGRAARIARTANHLATVLPFEAPFWRNAGATAEYVGHPLLEWLPDAPRSADGERLALLPGSRAHEVRAHLEPMLRAAAALARPGAPPATLILAPGLERRTRALAESSARQVGVVPSTASVRDALPGHDVALVCSGTATLESAALAVPPVIVYRTDPVTYALAKRLVSVPHVGLPNLVLGRRAFPEVLQEQVTADQLERAVRDVRRAADGYRGSCVEVRNALRPEGRAGPSERVAAVLRPWLAEG